MFNQNNIKPMLLKEVDKPFQDYNYFYELKYDGIRALVFASKDELRIITRNGNDVTKLYPEFKSIQKLVKNHQIIFDGEIVAFENGKPSFSVLQQRSHLKNNQKIKEISEDIPVCFVAFDIIFQNRDLTNLALIKRKKILNQFSDTEIFMKANVYENGVDLFKKVKKLGLEGIVAKEKNSFYFPGKRVDYWLKIKNFKVEEFYIHGYLKLQEKYSLLLGEYRGNHKLYYVGKVSVSIQNEVLKEVLKEKDYPNTFINFNESANFVKPIYTIKVHYMEKTKHDTLRQPFVKK